MLRWWLVPVLLVGCATRQPVNREPAPPIAPGPVAGPAVGATPPTRPPRPALDRDPRLGVLLIDDRRVAFTLLQPATLPDGSRLPAGPVTAEADGDGIRIDGRRLASPTLLRIAGSGPRFQVEVTSPIPPRNRERMRLGGEPLLAASNGRLQLIEQTTLEAYLPGVITVEMSPSYPAAALQAQAVAARSYTAARWWVRWDRPWQVHWHFTRDMAYRGLDAPGRAAGEAAVRATRGRILFSGGAPVLALFHAASGGRTESSDRLVPDAPGKAVMVPVDDAPSIAGAKALGLDKTHVAWRTFATWTDLGEAVRGWAADEPGKPRVGTVTGLAIGERSTASGRVTVVEVRHRLDGRTQTLRVPAGDLRLAYGPGRIRSTWWTGVTAAKDGVAITGKGFGHGVGLSQVGAWSRARGGDTAAEILAAYYPGSRLQAAY